MLATFVEVPPEPVLTGPRTPKDDVALFKELTRLPMSGVRLDWVAAPLERRASEEEISLEP